MNFKIILAMVVLSTSTIASASQISCKEDFESRKGNTYNPIAKCSVLLSAENTEGVIGNPIVDICIGSSVDPRDNANVIYIFGDISSDPNERNAAAFISPRMTLALGDYKWKTKDGSEISQSATDSASELALRVININPSAMFDTNKDNSDGDTKVVLNKTDMKLSVSTAYRTNWPVKNPIWKKSVSYVLQCETDK